MQIVHPSPAAIRLAMSRIETALDSHGSDQDVPMDWGIILRDACRTTACHAGWYAFGRFMNHPAIRWRHDRTFYSDPGDTMLACRVDGTVTHLMYHEGAHVLARDLGFMNSAALKGWAARHPEIWGNTHGDRMFAGNGAIAFGKPPFTHLKVSEIISWWLAVASRLDDAIQTHPDRTSAIAALDSRDPHTQQNLTIEACPAGYRIVRQPYPVTLP